MIAITPLTGNIHARTHVHKFARTMDANDNKHDCTFLWKANELIPNTHTHTSIVEASVCPIIHILSQLHRGKVF